jgi:hypothetical protein
MASRFGEKGVSMKFEDVYTSKELRHSIGVESTSGRYYASMPVSNGLVDYEEYYQITQSKYEIFLHDKGAAMGFIEACRRREHDALLLQKPGRNRGIG